MLKQKTSIKCSTYYIHGLHCPACELLIEKKIAKLDSVKKADVSMSSETVTIEYNQKKEITPEYLNKIFKDDGYKFSINAFGKGNKTNEGGKSNLLTSYLIAGFFIIGYILLSRSGLASLVSVDSQSSLLVFLMFGLLAGVSSCAALVGGIILSISKQWLSVYSKNDSILTKTKPHILFNIGRVVGYSFFGAILGSIGEFFTISPLFTAIFIIGISLIMVLLGLQMIGIKAFKNFQIRLPKSITNKVADESNFTGRFAPLLMGALTFFLPCGFTITAQALALASGDLIQGALILGSFALGTVPGLLAIGFGSVKLYSSPKWAKQFSLIAGLLVLFFAALNINSQLAVLGVSNTDDLISKSLVKQTEQSSSLNGLPEIVNGVQIVKIKVSSYSYTPNRIRMRANTPTRWEITDAGFSGCTSTVISRGLFDGQIELIKNGTAIKEFISPKPGVYKFSCLMGMVSGSVEVVDSSGSTGKASTFPVESGAKGCGCGGSR